MTVAILIATAVVLALLLVVPIADWYHARRRRAVCWSVNQNDLRDHGFERGTDLRVWPTLNLDGRVVWRAEVAEDLDAGHEIVRDLGVYPSQRKARRAAIERAGEARAARALLRSLGAP
jgi:hypothetical protein